MTTEPERALSLTLPDGQRLPTWAELSVAINQLVTERDSEWAGVPMVLPGTGLVLEDRHPWAGKIADLQRIVDGDVGPLGVPREHPSGADASMLWREVNHWHGRTKSGLTGDIVIMRHADGRTRWGIDPDIMRRNQFQLFGPFEALDAWNLQTECAAMARLETLLTPRMFMCYLLTGQFLETSKRSGLTYVFRRLKPTVVLTPHKDPDQIRILTSLCLHPLGFYLGSRCGAMCPSDDIIAHLIMMRADEAKFWQRANQHPPSRPEAGL